MMFKYRVESSFLWLATCLCLSLLSQTTWASHAAPTDANRITLWHWWNSQGERQSIDILNTHLATQGLQLKDDQAKASSTGSYLNNFKSWLKTEKLPTAAMMVSSEINSLAASGALLNMDAIAQQQGWEEFIPHAIQDTAKYQGHWVSAPINSHSTNWIWVNKALFSRLDLPEPETWQDLIAVLQRARALGIPALASLDNDWEQALLFELVALSTGGLEFYRRFFVNGQIQAQDHSVLVESFLRLKQLSTYFTADTHSLNWNQITSKLADGQFLMQIHGSWVNSELSSLGKTADVDYLCLRFPDTQGAYLFHSDHFIFLKNTSSNAAQQQQLAQIMLDKELQRELSIASGATPVRVDISTEGFNSCARKSMHDLRMANMRRAVMASMNNNHLFTIAHEYLTEKISEETAADQVIQAYRSPENSAESAAND